MSDITKRLDTLTPRQRPLLELQLRMKGLDALRREPAPAPPAEAESRKPEAHAATPGGQNGRARAVEFSLFFFSDDGSKADADKYRLLMECARFADAHGFSAVWTPERHFQDFGGLYPNPSVLSAALAMITKNVSIRAGSVALPLHSPVRVAEEWAVVDNLSNGRVAVAFASGWHPSDFVLSPHTYEDRKEQMFRNILTVQRLWAGETVTLPGVGGRDSQVRTLPRPVQPRLPTWVSISSQVETWVKAGEIGANVLTAVLRQPPRVLAEKIRLYREARARHGHDPEAGRVTVMAHAFVGESDRAVKELVRAPLTHYFRTNIRQFELQTDLLARDHAGAAPFDPDSLNESDLDVLASCAFERYFDDSMLCGTPEKCSELVNRLVDVGANEVACLVDFGVGLEPVLDSLRHLNVLRERFAG